MDSCLGSLVGRECKGRWKDTWLAGPWLEELQGGWEMSGWKMDMVTEWVGGWMDAWVERRVGGLRDEGMVGWSSD